MSMLAEPRRRKQYHLNPRGKALYEDDSRFGTKMLEKMGWSKGKGLGAKENGSLDFVRVRYKDDAEGLGFDADARDDQWTAHEQSFSGLLKSLNGEAEDAVDSTENNGDSNKDASDDEMRPLGFGFQVDPVVTQKKSKKLTEKISGESLEEKSKASKARVHYKKFTRGKDLSRYSEKDLANIFGKKAADVQADDGSQNLINPVEDETTNFGENEVQPNFGGVQTSSSGLSVTDYFKQKMAALKNKLNNTSKEESESQSLLDKTEVPESEPENASKEPKRKKKRKHENTSEETELLPTTENVESKRKKKKKNVVEDEKQETTAVLENNADSMKNEENSQKKKKSKKESKKNRIEDVEINSHQSEEKPELQNDDEKENKKKKSKKAKKEKIEDYEEANGKQIEDEDLMLVENVDVGNNDNNERSQKKKKKKKNKERIEMEESAATIESSITEMRVKEEPVKKKTKKSKKNKESTEEEDISVINPKKMKSSGDDDAVPLAPHDVSETLENSETPGDKSSNDESDASEVAQPQKELLSMDELLKKRDSFNVLTISTFCAEQFRHFNMEAYEGSTLPQIIGYGFDENLKLNIVEARFDKKRILDLWMGRISKYTRGKRQFHRIAICRNRKQKVKHLKAFKRLNIFTVV